MKVKVNYSPTLKEVNELDLALATTPKGECIIGRSPDCDLVLESPDVSRVHGKFFVRGNNYYFSDIGSRNGSVINGKLVKKDLPVELKDKDIIRIGDYVMTVEEIIPVSEELPETVFRTIDPGLFARWQSNENVNNINFANPAPGVIREVPQQLSSEAAEEFIAAKSEVEISDLEQAINSLENFIETPQAANEVPADASNLNYDAATPVVEEVTFVQPQDLISSIPDAVIEVPADVSDLNHDAPTPVVEEEVTFMQPQDLICSIPEAVSEVPFAVNDQDIDWDAEIPQEFTIVQLRNIESQPSDRVNEVSADDNDDFSDLEMPILQEFTNVQPRDLVRQPAETVSEVTAEINDQDIDLDAENLREFTIVQPRNVVNQTPERVIEVLPHISNEVIENEFKVDIGGVEAPEFVDSFPPEFSHEDATFTEDILIDPSELFSKITSAVSNQVADIKTDDADVFTEVAVPNEVSELDALSTPVNQEADAEVIPQLIPITSESISQLFAEISEEEEESSKISQEVSVSKPQQIIAQQNIVLLAHESKKLELAEFVNHHQEFFAQSLTVAWPSISEVLHKHTSITISQQIPAATSGGYQTINALVNSGDISAVIFLRDFLIPQTGQANEEALLRSCNINKVLLATNVPTAEAIVYYLEQLQSLKQKA